MYIIYYIILPGKPIDIFLKDDRFTTGRGIYIKGANPILYIFISLNQDKVNSLIGLRNSKPLGQVYNGAHYSILWFDTIP